MDTRILNVYLLVIATAGVVQESPIRMGQESYPNPPAPPARACCAKDQGEVQSSSATLALNRAASKPLLSVAKTSLGAGAALAARIFVARLSRCPASQLTAVAAGGQSGYFEVRGPPIASRQASTRERRRLSRGSSCSASGRLARRSVATPPSGEGRRPRTGSGPLEMSTTWSLPLSLIHI